MAMLIYPVGCIGEGQAGQLSNRNAAKLQGKLNLRAGHAKMIRKPLQPLLARSLKSSSATGSFLKLRRLTNNEGN